MEFNFSALWVLRTTQVIQIYLIHEGMNFSTFNVFIALFRMYYVIVKVNFYLQAFLFCGQKCIPIINFLPNVPIRLRDCSNIKSNEDKN